MQHAVHDHCTLTLDGYLDNREALGQTLALPAQNAEPISDAAIALRVWQRWGQSGLTRLHGPFTLTLIDRREPQRPQTLLYREALGRRSLFYHHAPPALHFAREPAELLAHPAISSQPDELWLASHFALTRPSDHRTPFRAIHRLLPGECLIHTPDGISLHREPLRLNRQPLHYPDPADYADQFRELLDQAVARCLRDAGDRVGIMLSGGMDSGPIAALAHRQLTTVGRTLTAYSWALPDHPGADESAEITACADHIGCGLHLLPGGDEWPMRDLATWPVNPNSPTTNGFRRLKLRIYRAAAADGCRVILNGAAGDQLYPHRHYSLLESWRDQRYGALLGELLRIAHRNGLIGFWRNPAVRHWGKHLLGWQGRPPTPPVWLSAAARQHWQETHAPWPPEAVEHPRPDHYQAALGQRAADGLASEAFFARRCGLDRRDPYHDQDLIEFMLAVPSEYCYRQGHTKWLAREAMHGLLPESIRLRPRGGLLGEFFDCGYARQHDTFKRLLTAPDATWPAYVDQAWLMRALSADPPSEPEKLLVWYCAAFELWRQALSGAHPELLHFAHGSP